MKQSELMNNEIWWQTHPCAWVGIFVKHDYFSLSLEEFVAKYITKMENEIEFFGHDAMRAKTIASFIHPLYHELTGRNYDTNLIAL